MAFVDKIGGKHTNHDTMKQADMKHMAKSPASAAIHGEEASPAPSEGGSDGAAMAQQHGPAVQIDIQHQGGQHTVHAMHPDGHEHDSQHGSAAEAHQFAGDCAGCM